MNRFWDRFIGPIIETAKPDRILEVGALYGWNTRHILDYCRRTGARADIVDTVPQDELRRVLAAYPAEHILHVAKSVDAIPRAGVPDLALIDGDHNWRTVFDELNLLFTNASKAGKKEPIVLLHDCAWPYARRDMYYDPSDFDDQWRHPFAYRGMVPGVSELVDFGMNGVLANALQEGGPQNGVLTAVEDFIVACPVKLEFRLLPFFNGLGILIPTTRMTPELKSLVDSFFSPDSLLQTCAALEEDGMRMRVEVTKLQALLTQRTDALERARRILEERGSMIENLRRELEAGPSSSKATAG